MRVPRTTRHHFSSPRSATSSDLDSLADIACAALPLDPQWNYRFPKRQKYPRDHWNFTRDFYKSLLSDPTIEIKVVTTYVQKGEKGVERPVALSVWRKTPIAGVNAQGPHACKAAIHVWWRHVGDRISLGGIAWLSPPPYRLHLPAVAGFDPNPYVKGVQAEFRVANPWIERPDANLEHMKAFKETLLKAKFHYFDSIYGNKALQLQILATHPDYQRHGCGKRLCIWGINQASKESIPVTLFSSPMGRKLYTSLGFEYIDTVTVQVEGESDKLEIGVMVLPPNVNNNTGI